MLTLKNAELAAAHCAVNVSVEQFPGVVFAAVNQPTKVWPL